eukprot:scaffold44550_cov54-Cyclotella_meneghiniana.AAC.13
MSLSVLVMTLSVTRIVSRPSNKVMMILLWGMREERAWTVERMIWWTVEDSDVATVDWLSAAPRRPMQTQAENTTRKTHTCWTKAEVNTDAMVYGVFTSCVWNNITSCSPFRSSAAFPATKSFSTGRPAGRFNTRYGTSSPKQS